MPPPSKRRKLGATQVQELTFDPAARQEYLTGFSKRKKARIQHARDEAVKREKEEKVRGRRQLREKRKEDLEQHVEAVNAELKKQNAILDGRDEDEDESPTWEGITDQSAAQAAAAEEEEEYVDEDKYTTVTVEAMEESGDEDVGEEEERRRKREREGAEEKAAAAKKKRYPGAEKVKSKKKKFRYESKAERAMTRQKQKSKNRNAKARRQGDS